MWGNFGKGRGKGYGGYGKGQKGWASSSWDTTYNHDSAGKGKAQGVRRRTGTGLEKYLDQLVEDRFASVLLHLGEALLLDVLNCLLADATRVGNHHLPS